MRVTILHNFVPPDAPPEDQDTLVEVAAVSQALIRLGHEPTTLACSLDLAAMRDELARLRPDVVFNLVESLAGSDSLVYLPAAVLDTLGIPYCGSRTESLFLTAHKTLAKQRLRQAGLPTPEWLESSAIGRPTEMWLADSQASVIGKSSWIIKGVWDQGSRGMDDDAVVRNVGLGELRERLLHRAARTGQPCFAEQFVEGREFNLSVVAQVSNHRWQEPRAVFSGADIPVCPGDRSQSGRQECLPHCQECLPGGHQTLPAAEIVFHDFPPDKPRIVGHRAKWDEDSFECRHTIRSFNLPASDDPLVARLDDLAHRCWMLFDLRGWARVDFRVDQWGQPWILEVNANPCISPDAGFAAALERASIPYDEGIRRILEDRGR
jgi:D-alanine-D-alanine ligase